MIMTRTATHTFGSTILFPLNIHLVLCSTHSMYIFWSHDFTDSMYILSIILLNVICGLTSTKVQTFTHNALVHSPDRYNEVVTYTIC